LVFQGLILFYRMKHVADHNELMSGGSVKKRLSVLFCDWGLLLWFFRSAENQGILQAFPGSFFRKRGLIRARNDKDWIYSHDLHVCFFQVERVSNEEKCVWVLLRESRTSIFLLCCHTRTGCRNSCRQV